MVRTIVTRVVSKIGRPIIAAGTSSTKKMSEAISRVPIRAMPLLGRIFVLTTVVFLPPGLVLGMVTPVTIRRVLPDVRQTGRVVGLVYACGTLGSLVGNFATGFWLIPALGLTGTSRVAESLNAAVGLLALATSFFMEERPQPPEEPEERPAHPVRLQGAAESAVTPRLIRWHVFICGFVAIAAAGGLVALRRTGAW